MDKVAINFTIQQLLDNQTGAPLAGDDKVILIVEMPFTANPNGWVTGRIAVSYDDITFLENPATVVETFNQWIHDSFVGSTDYNPNVDRITFGLDPEGYLAVAPRPGLGYQFVRYSSFSGPLAEDVDVKDLGVILGISQAINNTEAQCPLPSTQELRVFLELNTGESVSIYRAAANGDQLVATIPLANDGGNPNEELFLQGVKNALNDAGVNAVTEMHATPENPRLLPSFVLSNPSEDCAILKLKLKRNSDALSRFHVAVDNIVGGAPDARYQFPRPEQYNYLTLWVSGTGGGNPQPVADFIKFRNRSPGQDHRLELIPTVIGTGDAVTIEVKDGEDLELGGSDETGYGICLSQDLCALTGRDLDLYFVNELEVGPNAAATLIDKRRGKTLGTVKDLHLITDRFDRMNAVADLLRTAGLLVTLNAGELDWSLTIANPTQQDITVELFLPFAVPTGSMPDVVINGDVNTLQKPRDFGVYGATYSIAFCVVGTTPVGVCQLAPSEWSNDITFEEVNVPNQWGSISVSLYDSQFGGWNVGVDLTANNTIQKFIDNVISQGPDMRIETRVSATNPNAINIRYMGEYWGQPAGPGFPNEPRETVFKKMDPGPTQDNRDQPWAQGTMAETRVCLANFFTNVPVTVNCYNTNTIEPS